MFDRACIYNRIIEAREANAKLLGITAKPVLRSTEKHGSQLNFLCGPCDTADDWVHVREPYEQPVVPNVCTLIDCVQDTETTRERGEEHSQGGRICMRSNAAMASASMHSTSVHLGLAADSIAQADYDMASDRSLPIPNVGYQFTWGMLEPASPMPLAPPVLTPSPEREQRAEPEPPQGLAILAETAARRFAGNTQPSNATPIAGEYIEDLWVLEGEDTTCGLQAIALAACERG